MKKDDIYIEVLKFGRENLHKAITFKDLTGYLDKHKINYNDFITKHIFISKFINQKGQGRNINNEPDKNGLFILGNEGYFNLLEHEELKSANSSSRTATYFATAALLVSIIATSLSTYFFYRQQDSVTRLDELQIKKILSIKDTNTNTQLKDIIQKQIEIIDELKKIVQSDEQAINKNKQQN